MHDRVNIHPYLFIHLFIDLVHLLTTRHASSFLSFSRHTSIQAITGHHNYSKLLNPNKYYQAGYSEASMPSTF